MQHSKNYQNMEAGFDPLRSSLKRAHVFVSNIRIMVPFSEDVAKYSPEIDHVRFTKFILGLSARFDFWNA